MTEPMVKLCLLCELFLLVAGDQENMKKHLGEPGATSTCMHYIIENMIDSASQNSVLKMKQDQRKAAPGQNHNTSLNCYYKRKFNINATYLGLAERPEKL